MPPSDERRQSRREIALLISLPVLADLLVAIVMVILIVRAGNSPGGLPIDLVPVGPEVPHSGPLAVSAFDQLISVAQDGTDERYSCLEPWHLASGSIKWACRTPESLVVVEANAGGEVYQLDVTWFGFDASKTNLPAWAAATQASNALATEAEAFVRAHLGSVGEVVIGGSTFTVGGARGALTLRVAG